MSSLRERYRYLPFPLPILLEKAGEAFMLRAVAALGGVSIKIPVQPDHRSAVLAERLGEADAAILVRILAPDFPRLSVSFPSMRATRQRNRDIAILKRRHQGEPVRSLARHEGLSERAVYQALRRCREQGLTADMPIIDIPAPNDGVES